MIRLHCTKKLLAKLPLRDDGRLLSQQPSFYAANDEAESLLSGWHANLLMLQRRQCVLFVHDTTRFPVLLLGLKKPDFAELDYWFVDGFMNTLLKTGADDALMQRAHATQGALVCDSVCNRSVQGTMNQMKQDIEFQCWHDRIAIDDLSPYRMSAWLADRPCHIKGVKDCIWPIEAMYGLLETT